ncbi:hypothetical protein C8T65DRAFT_829492 [Cerioporus squamosus]|nr:hypothetical protein C8T65DRAFT_829492 [Cerioporus squamosus]
MTVELNYGDLSIFPATSEQVQVSRSRYAAQWSIGRSLEAYLQRDVVLDAEEHAANGKLTTWVLAPRNRPTTLDFLCSCETFRRAALVARPRPSATSGHGDVSESETQVEEVTAYAITSVFTSPKHRKKGYGRHMLRLLHWVLAPRSALPSTFPPEWGTPPDIEMLKSSGSPTPSSPFSIATWGATSWNLDASDSDVVAAKKPGARVVRLSESDVAALYEHDARWVKEDLVRYARPGRTQFTFLPNKGVGLFVVRRTMDFTPDLQPVLPSEQWGAAILPDGAQTLTDALAQPSPLSFVTWTLDLKTSPRTLVVSRLRADEDTLPVLLDELLAAARDEKVEKVEFWYMRPELRELAESMGWKTEERVEHLSAVKWYGHERDDELEWLYNEK